MENGHYTVRSRCYEPLNKVSLHWLELRVFYVRLSHCVFDDESTPEFVMLNHVPLNEKTLLAVNGSRTSTNSDCISTILKRDRLDKKSEEVTFVSTDSIRTTGSMKFEVLHKGTLVLSGVLDLCLNNGFHGESKQMSWSMNCDPFIPISSRALKECRNHYTGLESSPVIDVYVAGCFSGCPIVLTKTLLLHHQREKTMKGAAMETALSHNGDSCPLPMKPRHDNSVYEERKMSQYLGMQCSTQEEDGVLSWFNAGVRVGVGIGLSICLGLGIGAGLLIQTYQGTTRNFRRRQL